jgi:CheY-like chemotaxis protein
LTVSHGDVRHQQLLTDLEETLADLGHEVVAKARTSRQLVKRCREASPDPVITDIKMLDLDGLKAAKQIRGT